jgi:hypothetical protein
VDWRVARPRRLRYRQEVLIGATAS